MIWKLITTFVALILLAGLSVLRLFVWVWGILFGMSRSRTWESPEYTLQPPHHPNCRCAIVPVFVEKIFVIRQDDRPCPWMDSGPGATIDLNNIPVKKDA